MPERNQIVIQIIKKKIKTLVYTYCFLLVSIISEKTYTIRFKLMLKRCTATKCRCYFIILLMYKTSDFTLEI